MTKKHGFWACSATVIVFVGLTAATQAFAAMTPEEEQKYFTLGSVQVTETPDSPAPSEAGPSAPPSGHIGALLKTAGGGGLAAAGPDPVAEATAIVNLGLQIWKVIQDGAPALGVESASANALPSKANWQDMTGWSEPRSTSYRVVYTNLFGINVVDFAYSISYLTGGQYRGRGHYIENVSTVVDHLNLAWGFKFDASAEVPSVTNAGSEKDPIASAQIRLHWTVKDVLMASYETHDYTVSGTGNFRDISADPDPSTSSSPSEVP